MCARAQFFTRRRAQRRGPHLYICRGDRKRTNFDKEVNARGPRAGPTNHRLFSARGLFRGLRARGNKAIGRRRRIFAFFGYSVAESIMDACSIESSIIGNRVFYYYCSRVVVIFLRLEFWGYSVRIEKTIISIRDYWKWLAKESLRSSPPKEVQMRKILELVSKIFDSKVKSNSLIERREELMKMDSS